MFIKYIIVLVKNSFILKLDNFFDIEYDLCKK